MRFSRIYERVFSDHRRGLRSRGPGHVLPSDSPSSRKLTAALGVLLPAGQARNRTRCTRLPHSIHMGTPRPVRPNFSLTTSLHDFTPRQTAVDSGLSPQYARNGRHGDKLPTILANRKLQLSFGPSRQRGGRSLAAAGAHTNFRSSNTVTGSQAAVYSGPSGGAPYFLQAFRFR